MRILGQARKGASCLLAILVVPCLLAGSLSALLPQEALAATGSDNFDRADGGLGSNWTAVTGTAAPKIVSSNLRAGTGGAVNSAYWSASTFGSDQFAQASSSRGLG